MEETMKSYNKQEKAKRRKKSSLIRLNEQLVKATKSVLLSDPKSSKKIQKDVPLEERDLTRIKKEIQVLQTRI